MNRVVFIAGTGHCGSTLLDLILSSHPHAFGLGEMTTLVNEPQYLSGERPICDINGFNDTFWTDERVEYLRKHLQIKSRFKRILAMFTGHTSRRNHLFDYLFQESGASVLIDSSKNVGWISDRVREIDGLTIKPLLIYMTRDGRAVINSHYQKYPDRGLEAATNDWLSRIEAFKQLYADFKGAKSIVSYEEFTDRPKSIIKQLCTLVEIQYEEEMMEFWKFDHHHIAGNSGTKSLIHRYRSGDANANDLLDRRKEQYYKDHPFVIQADLRWQNELSQKELEYIESRISHVNLH